MSPSGITTPLRGIKVIDLTRAVAGPFCTMLLGDLGARVIKVEEPGSGDETRAWGPPFLGKESAYFLSLNRNKQSIAIDLKQESGRQTFLRLVSDADVVVQNFRPGVVDRLGIDYATLKAKNPRLVYASVSGFGQTGPDRLKPGYDLIVQAISGVMMASAGPDSKPSKAPFPVADVLAALFTCQGILAALYDRERTGEGQHVEVSLLEALLASMSPLSSSYLLAGQALSADGTPHTNVVPYQVFRCQDECIVVAVPNERIWQRFTKAIDRPEWLQRGEYRSNGDRHLNRKDLVREIEETLSRLPAAEWLRILEQHEVPCAPILPVGPVFDYPQLIDRESVVEIHHQKLGPLKFVANPMRFSNATLRYEPPPALDEHGQEILAELSEESAAQA